MVYGFRIYGLIFFRIFINEFVKDFELIRLCWKEYFSNLLNCNVQVDLRVVDEFEQYFVRYGLVVFLIFDKVEKVLRFLKSGKVLGFDGIFVEVIKVGGF